MLDFIRRNVQSTAIKVMLGSVAFILVCGMVWGTVEFSSGSRMDSTAATVNDRQISLLTYNRAKEQQIQMFRSIYKDQLSLEMLERLGIGRNTINNLIERELVLQKAKELGIEVTDDEVRQRIMSYQAFLTNNTFDPDKYKQLLTANNKVPAQFEQDTKEDMIIDKVRGLIEDQVKISPEEVRQDYIRINQKYNAQYLTFGAHNYQDKVKVNEADLTAYFNTNKEKYRKPEQRRVQYILVDIWPFLQKAKPSEQEIQNYYEDNPSEFKYPKQWRASHILFKVGEKASPDEEGKTRRKAEDVLKKVKSGGDFAELAKTYSEDSASAQQGGDLGYFSQGKMVKPFEDAALALESGQISSLVRTTYGFHIIKVTDIKPESNKSMEESRQEIAFKLKRQIAEDEAQEVANKAYSQLLANPNFEKVAQGFSLKAKQTDFFDSEGIIIELGAAPQFVRAAFELIKGQVSQPVKLPQGCAVMSLLETKAPYIPELAEVKAAVEKDFMAQESRKLAKAAAEDVSQKLKSGQTLADIAKTYKLEPKDTGDFTPVSGITDIGPIQDWLPQLMSLAEGQTSAVLNRQDEDKFYVFVMGKHLGIDEEKFKQDKVKFTRQLQYQKGNLIYADWVESLRAEAKIELNQNLFPASSEPTPSQASLPETE